MNKLESGRGVFTSCGTSSSSSVKQGKKKLSGIKMMGKNVAT